MRRCFWLLATASLLLLPLGCNFGNEPIELPNGTPTLRVLLVESHPTITLVATASPTLRIGSRSPVRLEMAAGPAVVTLSPAGWNLGGASLPRETLTLIPSEDGSIQINGVAYHGQFRLVPTAPDQFSVINDVNIEDYLRGVLGRELFASWHAEAYKAQAIVARTYALYEARTTGAGRDFDVYCDQRSQVYGGIPAESSKSRAAVASTLGIVLAWGPPGHERIFKAYFSSCCGGVTQSAADAFGDPDIPPLSAQLIGPRCAASPKFNWGPVVISKSELTRRLRAWGAAHNQPEQAMFNVERVDIQFTNQFGRPVRFAITDIRGTRYSLSGEDFRQAFDTSSNGGPTLFSSFFQPINDPTDIRIVNGHGFGHGVGLCQWCAEREASMGVSAEEIATSAYPGSKLVRVY